jgi:ABC-2 type transport system permease protein
VWVPYALAVASGKHERIFYTVQQMLHFPLLILSGTMLPLESGPSWTQLLSRINRLTHVVEAERAPFAGDFSHPSSPIGALAVGVVGLTVGRAPCAVRPIDRFGTSCIVMWCAPSA